MKFAVNVFSAMLYHVVYGLAFCAIGLAIVAAKFGNVVAAVFSNARSTRARLWRSRETPLEPKLES